jgi:hypothetical protein
MEALNIDNTLYEILTLETDIENAVGKYQNSIAAARSRLKNGNYCRKPFDTSLYPGGRRNLL